VDVKAAKWCDEPSVEIMMASRTDQTKCEQDEQWPCLHCRARRSNESDRHDESRKNTDRKHSRELVVSTLGVPP